MAPPTVQTLQRLAAETGYQLDTLEKVLRLLELLDEIAQDPVLSQRLALKGGTALNVFYLDLDRLSVDIDLNYVGAPDLAAMERERPEVDAAIDRLFASQGYGVRRRPTAHAGGKWLARYASALGGNASLELDLNYMARQPLFGAARMESRILGRVGTERVLVLDLHEIVAGKIVALLDRGAARDLFDVRRILAIEGLDRSWIKAAVLALGACNRRDWRGVSKDAIGCDSRTRVSPQSRHLPAPRSVPRCGRCGHVDRTVRGDVQGRARLPLRVVGERAELSRRGPRPWRGERESARRRARSRSAHRGHADACLEVQARSQTSGSRAVREAWCEWRHASAVRGHPAGPRGPCAQPRTGSVSLKRVPSRARIWLHSSHMHVQRNDSL